MHKSKIFKALALLNFVLFLTLFLLYRNGSFDRYFYNDNTEIITSPNGGTPTQIAKDSTVQIKDSLQPTRLSSSKSAIIIEHKKLIKDTTQFPPDSLSLTKYNWSENDKQLMYSSKSGIIVKPRIFKPDSLMFKPKKQEKN